MYIQITTSTFGKAGEKPIHYLKKQGISYRTNPYGRRLTEEEAAELLQDSHGVIAGTEPLTRKVLENATELKVISRCGTGMNNVDLDAANQLGIQVFNTPDIHVDAVAELALAGLLALMRQLPVSDKNLRSGMWVKKMGQSLYGKKMGLIGFGKVAKRLATLLKPFTNHIGYYDPYISSKEQSNIAVPMELDELLGWSDIISIHVPYSENNRHIIGADELAKIKSEAIILNTSRGGLIDENALVTFLKKNPKAGAYLDVFEDEPYTGPLTGLENVVLTPHVGTTTRETREEMEYQASVNLIKGLNND